MRQTIKHNLRTVVERLTAEQPAIAVLYLFGSRAYGTLSPRSDCDIIVRAAPDSHIKGSDLRDFAAEHCAPLDLFLCTGSRATSVANDSYVYAADFDALIAKLDAQLLWTRAKGFADFAFIGSDDWTFEVSSQAEFVASMLPDAAISEMTWQYKVQKVEALGLPSLPYIGDSLAKASAQIIEIARRMIMKPADLIRQGQARSGWTLNLQSEYDCQNLFFSVVKPWLPGLAREQVAIVFDGQEKRSDFSLFNGRLVIEMKFIDDKDKKREVVRTLAGLAGFYRQNANVGALLFILYVKDGVDVDDRLWEQTYSTAGTSPWVTTVVIRIPSFDLRPARPLP